MGSAASALALGEDPDLAEALVLDSAYGRLDRAITGWWRFIGGWWLSALLWPMPLVCWPLLRVNPFRVDVSRAIDRIKCPILFFHGDRDDLALPSEAKRNLEAVSGEKRIVWLEGCGHSEGRWLQPDRYHRALLAFLDVIGFIPKTAEPTPRSDTAEEGPAGAARTSIPD
jgi:pimeloyl-ACP methyl ester carboxylesterase